MRITTKFIASAALLLATTTVHAGGLSPEIMEAPVVVQDDMGPAGSSVNPTYIVLGVLAALLIAAALNDDDDDDDDDDPQMGEETAIELQ